MAPSKVFSHGNHPAAPYAAPQDTSTACLLIAAAARMMNIVEVREMFMIYLDPLSMWNLISLHSGALATFLKKPAKFINGSIYQIPTQIFAVTILYALEQKPKEVPLEPEMPSWDSLSPEEQRALEKGYKEDALKRDYYDRSWYGKPNTELEKFLNDEVQHNRWDLEEDVKDPMRKLKQLARMYDAVETLASSRIWNHVDDPELGAGLEPNNRWDAQIDEIRDALWIYQLYCVLFRETGTTESGEALFPTMHVQEMFLAHIERDLTDGHDVRCRLYGVFQDLSSFLGELYEQNYARSFVEAYKNQPEQEEEQKEEQEETDRDSWEPSKPWEPWESWKPREDPHPLPSVMCDTRDNFHGFVEYQMSLGLPFLVDIYRRSLETTRWQGLPPQKLWTQSFFSRARNSCSYWYTKRGFELTPMEEGMKGYKLKLVVWSSSGEYRLDLLDPIFTETDFKPTDMGDLSDWRQNGKADRFVQSGYGDDEYSENARKAIRHLIGADEAHIYFTPGGTGANLLSIASHLRPHEAIIAAEPGHIVGKEGGAIEATGHKILTEPGVNGKLTPEMIQSAFDRGSVFDWQPKPKMVFISKTTEMGTLYNMSELKAVAAVCKKLKLLLFLDGARLGAALTSSKNDVTLKDVYDLTDIFWIGGTKNGALLGEAIVIKDPSIGADFPYHMKQRGALLAKGRVLGIQFSTLLQDDLFFSLARYSNGVAADLSSSLANMGFRLWVETESNQVFAIFPPALVQELQQHFEFFVWEHLRDGSLVIRLVISWATERSAIKKFCTKVEEWTKRS